MVDDAAGDHQSGVQSTTCNATERMPCSCLLCQSSALTLGTRRVCERCGEEAERRTVIEPVPEAVEAILYKVFCCSEIEPWIDCIHPLANGTFRSSWLY